ncbi:MAG: restriction endonuclease subunit S [Porphyromonadaceae bacterium]|nr:restriction endonuclease subunit S [Porphyromonadaceae bacterium]
MKSIQNYIYTFKKGAGQPHVYAKDLATIQIPCPPDEVQQKVVEECEAIDKEYNNSRMEIEMYREKINEIFANLEKVDMGREKKLKELCNIEGGKRIPKGRGFSNQPTQHPYIRVTDFSRGTINMKDLKYIDDDVYKCISRYTISSDDIYLSIAGTIGVVGTIPSELNGANLTENAAKLVIKNKEEVAAKFLVYALQTKSAKEQIDSYTHAVGVPKLALERIREIKVYIPTIAKQNSIVYQVNTYEQAIEKAQAVMDGCATRIQAVLDKYLQP